MGRREFVTLTGSAWALPLLRIPVARAQESARIYRLGILTGTPSSACIGILRLRKGLS